MKIEKELQDKKKIIVSTSMESGFEPEGYNEIGIAILNNGALTISDKHRENHIYLYPDQLKALKDFLNEVI